MLHLKAALSLSTLMIAGAVTAYVENPKPEPVFIEGSQYTAVLHQRSHQWRVLGLDGHEIQIASSGSACAAQAPRPDGVWLVTRDAAGRPQLLAPSVTALPKGHPDHVRLVGCNESGVAGKTLAAPSALIDLLSESAGAVYVDE
jgi:hypothetical protein